jgi:hypothetical protein
LVFVQKRTIGVALAILILIALGAWFFWKSSQVDVAQDLVSRYDEAEKVTNRQPVEGTFAVVDQKIGEETKKGILAQPPARLIWTVTIPRDAWLRTYLGLQPQTWDMEGDGVLFRIGISDGKGKYEEFLTQHVNPQRRPEDRRWIPVDLDLSAYANQKVEVIFNTNASPPRRRGEKPDNRNDLPVFGAPEIYVR